MNSTEGPNTASTGSMITTEPRVQTAQYKHAKNLAVVKSIQSTEPGFTESTRSVPVYFLNTANTLRSTLAACAPGKQLPPTSIVGPSVTVFCEKTGTKLSKRCTDGNNTSHSESSAHAQKYLGTARTRSTDG